MFAFCELPVLWVKRIDGRVEMCYTKRKRVKEYVEIGQA